MYKTTITEKEFQKRWKNGNRGIAGLAVILILNLSVATAFAQSRRQNYDATVKAGLGGSGFMLGLGAVGCSAMTAGGCGAIIAAGTGLGILTGALGLAGPPKDDCADSMHCALPGDMPDYGGGQNSAHNPAMPTGGGDAFDDIEGSGDSGGYSDWNWGVPE